MMQKVALLGEFGEGRILSKKIEMKTIALVKIQEKVFAFDDRCTHKHYPLSSGFIDDPEKAIIQCAFHGAKFDLHTGKVVSLPATETLKVYPTEIKGGEVWVDV